MVRRLSIGKNNNLTCYSLAINPRSEGLSSRFIGSVQCIFLVYKPTKAKNEEYMGFLFIANKLRSDSQPRWLSRMHVRLVIRRSQVWSPSGLTTFFHGDWSWNIFYGCSLPFADQGWQSIDCPGFPTWEILGFPGLGNNPKIVILGITG